MAKKQRSGRVTPKGTRAPERKDKHRSDGAPAVATTFDRGVGKVGKRPGPVTRPITHNRGNR